MLDIIIARYTKTGIHMQTLDTQTLTQGTDLLVNRHCKFAKWKELFKGAIRQKKCFEHEAMIVWNMLNIWNNGREMDSFSEVV